MNKKIIIADDNRTSLMYVSMILRRFDFKVLPAEDGLEVLRIIKLQEADLVILDVHMKTMDGITVLRHIKSDASTASIPVLMLSTDRSSEMVETCSRLGAADYLEKPLKIDRLHAAVQGCFFSGDRPHRQHVRSPFHQKVTLSHEHGEEELFSETLSAGGIYVRTEKPYPVGTSLKVSIPLDGKGSVAFSGEVIYTKKLYGDFLTLPPGMAIRFQNLAAEQEDALSAFVEGLVAGDLIVDHGMRIFDR